MQFPSAERIFRQTGRTLARFPLVLLSAFVAVACAIYLAEQPREVNILLNIILVSLLGIPLLTTLTFSGEYHHLHTARRWLLLLTGILLLTGYLLVLPADLDQTGREHVYRYMLYVLGVHLLAAIGPFWRSDTVSTFWQYNKTLFLRFLTAAFFSAILFIGLAIALGSIEILLEIDIADQRYLQLFFIMAGLFNTWFFLAGIPASMQSLRDKTGYPNGLKLFTQNILIPLVVVYLVILYVYMAKIILQWSWPEGWVANLVLSFSIVGILALLLLHPIRDKVENKWIRTFSGSFYTALVPLTILLLLAIFRRIWEYGFTIERYFVMVLGFWLAAMVLYFLFSKAQNIKVIPGSLCILAFLISFGPWGAFSVSERSQINRLEHYLQSSGLLQDNAVRPATRTIPLNEQSEISSIIRYLNDTHDLTAIEPWFGRDLGELQEMTEADTLREVTYHERPRYIAEELLGIDYTPGGTTRPLAPERDSFFTERENILDVQGMNRVIQNVNWSADDSLRTIAVGGDTLRMKTALGDPIVYLAMEKNETDTVTVALDEVIRDLQRRYPETDSPVPAEAMTIDRTTRALSVRIYFERIYWREEDGTIIPESAQFAIGLK